MFSAHYAIIVDTCQNNQFSAISKPYILLFHLANPMWLSTLGRPSNFSQNNTTFFNFYYFKCDTRYGFRNLYEVYRSIIMHHRSIKSRNCMDFHMYGMTIGQCALWYRYIKKFCTLRHFVFCKRSYYHNIHFFSLL